MFPDISSLHIGGKDVSTHAGHPPDTSIPEDISCQGDRYMEKLKNYAKSLPYSIEPYSKMVEVLDFILLRITQCVEAQDYDPGFMQWDSMLT